MPPEMFRYTPLPAGAPTRLVALLPGKFNDTIECELFAAGTDSAPSSYEALSYTWGDPSSTTPIVVNGRRFNITTNLDCALRYLRRPDTKRRLWIDAICINQHDAREKEVQVRVMAALFKHSTKVLIWLGKGLEPSVLANGKSLMSISEIFEVISNVADGKGIAHLVGEMPWERWDRWIPSLLEMLKFPWFRRLWVVQETAMTPDPMLICGESSLPWQTLVKAHRSLPSTLTFSANGAVAMRGAFQNLDALVNCWRLHQLWGDDKTLPEAEHARRLILLLYSLMGKFLCSDERDRFYGIIGMAGDSELWMDIPVDYEKSAGTVFRDLAVYLIEARGSLDILTGDRVSFDPSEYPGKPSWVPTWSSYTTYTRSLYPLPSLWTVGPDAEPPKQPYSDYWLSEDRNTLYVKGVIIGTMVAIGTPPPYYPDTSRPEVSGEEHRKALGQLLTMWETEVVHMPLWRVRQGEEAFLKAVDEMATLWKGGIVHLPSLRESYATEPDIEAFRAVLLRAEEPGSRSQRVSEKQCYDILLGREDEDTEDEEVAIEMSNFSSFKWRDLNDMAPFRLSGTQFGIFESRGLYQNEPPYQTRPIIALFPGGPGPVALCEDEEGRYRFMGPCYVQGLESESEWLAFLEDKELMEFALI